MNQELEELKTQRLVLLGALSEDPEAKAKVDAAVAELNTIVEAHGDHGMIALALMALNAGIAQGAKA